MTRMTDLESVISGPALVGSLVRGSLLGSFSRWRAGSSLECKTSNKRGGKIRRKPQTTKEIGALRGGEKRKHCAYAFGLQAIAEPFAAALKDSGANRASGGHPSPQMPVCAVGVAGTRRGSPREGALLG
jgi:hypothetical protein